MSIKYVLGKNLSKKQTNIRQKIAEKNSSGLQKPLNKIVIMPDGPDHLNWLELGDKEGKGIRCVKVSWSPTFGHLWSSGWIDEENIEKARMGQEFSWRSSGIGGHGSP